MKPRPASAGPGPAGGGGDLVAFDVEGGAGGVLAEESGAVGAVDVAGRGRQGN